MQLATPDHWAQVQFQGTIVPDEDMLDRRHALELADLGRG
jgi:hypothetical protein